MSTGDQMHFAMAIHMLQRSNPAARPARDRGRGSARRHLGRVEASTERSSELRSELP